MTQSPAPIYNGRYELRSQIARGGTAHVYLAHDILLDRPVALKVLYPELSTNTSFVERFRREAQAAANLSHPNIVQIFDWGESANTYFIVMEYIGGEPLSSIIRTQAPIAADQAAAVAADIAKALGYAHRHGVVHRDVKPGNVLITQDGQVKVTDFGIARAIGADEQVTQTGLVMGTATYFSPEQAQGLEVDGRSDIYSLGVVLYEMITGRAPFAGETPVAIAYQHVREQPVSPRSVNSTIPSSLEAIVLQAMAKLPADRFRSADEMRADLDRFVRGQTVLAQPPSEVFTGPATEVIDADALNAHLGLTDEEEDEEEERRATNTRKWLVAGALLLVAMLLLVILGGQRLGYFGGSPYFAVPDVRGMKPASAIQTLKSAGLLPQPRTVPGTIANQHTVLTESPVSPSTVRKGTVITLTVAGAAPTASIPRVIGSTLNSAEASLIQAGFRWHANPVASLKAGTRQNEVLSQSPASGLTKPKGTLVTISYVQNRTVTVPTIIGENQVKAGSKLTRANLNIGRLTMTFSQTVPQGNVISASPAVGAVVREGTTVNLEISEGPGVTVPSLIGDSETQAIATITSLGLRPQKGAPIATSVAGYIGNVAAQRVLGSAARVNDQVAPGSVIIYRLGLSNTPTTTGNTGTTTTTTTGNTGVGTTTTTTTTATTPPPAG